MYSSRALSNFSCRFSSSSASLTSAGSVKSRVKYPRYISCLLYHLDKFGFQKKNLLVFPPTKTRLVHLDNPRAHPLVERAQSNAQILSRLCLGHGLLCFVHCFPPTSLLHFLVVIYKLVI